MNTKKNLLKISAMVGLLFAFTKLANAQSPNIYVCDEGTVTLGYVNNEYALEVGDKVIWVKWDEATGTSLGGSIEKTYNGSDSDVNFEIDGSSLTTNGEHHYRMYVIAVDPNSCGSDLSDPVEVYKLPNLNLALSATISAYCEALDDNPETSQPTQSEITATTTPDEALPAGILLEYAWSAEEAVGGPADIALLGTSTDNSTTATELTNTFTMTTTTVGVYEFSATVKYAALAADGTTKIKGGCETSVPEEGKQTVEVTAKPGVPSITVS
ncbi:hypothetical protein [Parapedobacter sp.]